MRTLLRRIALVGVVVMLAVGVQPDATAATTTPYGSGIRFTGYGWGHGWGMSQYGAHGAARQGLSWTQILSFYYPGTSRTHLPYGQRIRIWLTADNDNDLTVNRAVGLSLRESSTGRSYRLPDQDGTNTTQWRITRSGSSWQLARRDRAGRWHSHDPHLPTSGGTWSFRNPSLGKIRLILPNGSSAVYRGSYALVPDGSALRTVNTLWVENYLRGVVPSEMPASWPAHAVRAQSVAARTYAARRLQPAKPYDICDTTTCQVYKGMAGEHSAGDAAIRATDRTVLTYRGEPIDALFSSSNGGYTADGGQPYLPAKRDPYDSVVRNQVWTSSATTSEIGAAFGIGTLRSLTVVSRDGNGALGGRVESVRLTGTSTSVTVSGATLRSRLGLRSELVRITGGLRPGSGTYTKWQAEGGVTGWIGVPTGDERQVGDGSMVTMSGATLYRSSANGVHEVHGSILAKYDALGGPPRLGMPTTDEMVGDVSSVRKSAFTRGAIYWSSATGAHALWGPVRTKYHTLGSESSPLGMPTTDLQTGDTVEKAAFSDGAIYWSGATGARALFGPLRMKYWSLGSEHSALGLPLSDSVTRGGVATAQFQHGTISCRGSSCTVSQD